ncbi:hypothetical protein [Hymenobacter armeniacus]|uniref:Uncharacterized protein n=1 Tax=Hymenobacter armeniacus TaxID=2771358 RepID=A0ABR8JYJ7_9BACT|nr:hypothetical protein [Hymenobacter armeniacus]MBD2724250.1 hypothetical protein [Hymenobacter armeniacus]
MKLTYPATSSVVPSSPLSSTLCVWLCSNLGGTAHLIASFGLEEPQDVQVPLAIGLLASLISLAAVPVALPFFALAQRASAAWPRRFRAAVGVLLAFGAANYLLLRGLPVGPPENLLAVTWPYLATALLSAGWRYWHVPAAGHMPRTQPAPLLNAWRQRPGRSPYAHLAH